MQHKLTVRALRKAYADFVALHPTDLDVDEGEFLTLLGPSGSGKTTLLMMVAGLLDPDGGQVSIDGRDATYAPPHARDIGMVFQNYALFPHLSIFENIAFPLRMRRLPEADIAREVKRALEIVQLPHVANRLPRALSGGQQQRIALARCIVYRPSLILMDEPLGALDKKLRDQLQLEIKHLHKQLGTTILYVTHDQQEALTMSDRICLMNGGRIEQLGAPQDIYFRPATVFAADFLGESNIYSVTVADGGDGFAAVTGAAFGSQVLRAPMPPARQNAGASIMIRPERVALGPAPGPGFNTVSGEIRETIFVGGVSKFYVTLQDGTTLFGTALTSPTDRTLSPGDTVQVSWPVDATVILPAQAAGGAPAPQAAGGNRP